MPQLQEVNALPCDTGSSRTTLEADPEFSGLDFSPLTDDWNQKQGIYDPANVSERALWVRKWLRERKEQRIVVVAHGDILRRLTSWDVTPWANAEVREYVFEGGEEDEEARIVPVKGGENEKEGAQAPTSSSSSE